MFSKIIKCITTIIPINDTQKCILSRFPALEFEVLTKISKIQSFAEFSTKIIFEHQKHFYENSKNEDFQKIYNFDKK